MQKGELSIVTIKPDYGFGGIEVKCDLAIVPAYSTVIYEVEMVDFTQVITKADLRVKPQDFEVQHLRYHSNYTYHETSYESDVLLTCS